MIYQAQQGWPSSRAALVAAVADLAVAFMGTSFALLNYAFDEIANPALRKTRRRRGDPLLEVRGLSVDYVTETVDVRAVDQST